MKKINIIKGWNKNQCDLLFVGDKFAVMEFPGVGGYNFARLFPFLLLIGYKALISEDLLTRGWSFGLIMLITVLYIITVSLVQSVHEKLARDKFRKTYSDIDNVTYSPLSSLDYLNPGEFGANTKQEKVLLVHKKKYTSTKELQYKAEPLGDLFLSRQNRQVGMVLLVILSLVITAVVIWGFVGDSLPEKKHSPIYSSAPTLQVDNPVSEKSTTLNVPSPFEDIEYEGRLCVTEHDTEICDLSTTSHIPSSVSNYRFVEPKGNAMACVGFELDIVDNDDTKTGLGSTYCVTDIGNVYVDPTVEVKKRWGKIHREDSGQYFVDPYYDICIWTFIDGDASIPDMEIHRNIGPNRGYEMKAFCRSGDNQLDILTYE